MNYYQGEQPAGSVPLLLTITGPTACGKTALAIEVARRIAGEILSADSRQVFKGMDIGTGKDLSEYSTGGASVPYHLIDTQEPGTEYNVYRFQNDFIEAFRQVVAAHHVPILCGGSGLYVEAVVCNYQLPDAPIDEDYRRSLESYSDAELTARLASYIKLHNHTDTETRDRLVRALEIQEYARQHPEQHVEMPPMRHLIVGVSLPRAVLVDRIESRLQQRLSAGMVDEVARLLASGVAAERLTKYGLEYRHITRYLTHQCSYDEMVDRLFADIRHFSKRQMTWFRRMERKGVPIYWIDGQKSKKQNCDAIISRYEELQRGCGD